MYEKTVSAMVAIYRVDVCLHLRYRDGQVALTSTTVDERIAVIFIPWNVVRDRGMIGVPK